VGNFHAMKMHMGDWRYISTHSQPQQHIDVSSQLYDPCGFISGAGASGTHWRGGWWPQSRPGQFGDDKGYLGSAAGCTTIRSTVFL